jgi:RNA polymerase sigma factor (sigma-70 family)
VDLLDLGPAYVLGLLKAVDEDQHAGIPLAEVAGELELQHLAAMEGHLGALDPAFSGVGENDRGNQAEEDGVVDGLGWGVERLRGFALVEARFSTWLYSILEHKIADRRRTRYRHEEQIEESLSLEWLPDPRANQALTLEVREIVESLPEPHRRILKAKLEEGLTSKELEAELGLPVGTIDRKLSEAKET